MKPLNKKDIPFELLRRLFEGSADVYLAFYSPDEVYNKAPSMYTLELYEAESYCEGWHWHSIKRMKRLARNRDLNFYDTNLKLYNPLQKLCERYKQIYKEELNVNQYLAELQERSNEEADDLTTPVLLFENGKYDIETFIKGYPFTVKLTGPEHILKEFNLEK